MDCSVVFLLFLSTPQLQLPVLNPRPSRIPSACAGCYIHYPCRGPRVLPLAFQNRGSSRAWKEHGGKQKYCTTSPTSHMGFRYFSSQDLFLQYPNLRSHRASDWAHYSPPHIERPASQQRWSQLSHTQLQKPHWSCHRVKAHLYREMRKITKTANTLYQVCV